MVSEKHKEYMKAYYQANKEEQKASSRAYYQTNKEKLQEVKKVYRQTPNGKKSTIICKWKHSDLLHEDYNQLYESYLQSTHCAVCKSEYKDSFDRCMDHDHETGLFRQFLCRACNIRDSWKSVSSAP